MRKSILVILLIFIVSGVWIIFRMYNKPHRDPLSESFIQINANELFNSYENNETKANELYLDKVLAVKGKIAEITTNQEMKPVVALEAGNPMFGVRCTMENSILNIAPGDSVTIKGICSGYLSDVVIISAILIE